MNYYDTIDCLYDPETQAEVLRTFALYDDVFIRSLVARHPNTPYDILSRLVRDERYVVRMGVLTNQTITPELELTLINDDSVFVRSELATNTKNRDIMVKLLFDKSVTVLNALCYNENVTEDIYLRASALVVQENLSKRRKK